MGWPALGGLAQPRAGREPIAVQSRDPVVIKVTTRDRMVRGLTKRALKAGVDPWARPRVPRRPLDSLGPLAGPSHNKRHASIAG